MVLIISLDFQAQSSKNLSQMHSSLKNKILIEEGRHLLLQEKTDFKFRKELRDEYRNYPLSMCKYVSWDSEPLWRFTYIIYKEYKNKYVSFVLEEQKNTLKNNNQRLNCEKRAKTKFIEELTIDDYNDFVAEAYNGMSKMTDEIYNRAIAKASEEFTSTTICEIAKHLDIEINKNEKQKINEFLKERIPPKGRRNLFTIVMSVICGILATFLYSCFWIAYVKHTEFIDKLAVHAIGGNTAKSPCPTDTCYHFQEEGK